MPGLPPLRPAPEPRTVSRTNTKLPPALPRAEGAAPSVLGQHAEELEQLKEFARQTTARPAARTGEHARQSTPIDASRCINAALKAAALLPKVSAERAEVAHKLVNRTAKMETRKAFLQDRAVALVYGLMLHMEESWSQIGFGAWMPFRWPDQWLAFCGLLSRVLAANGLIHARHADTYRKLLDETPAVMRPGDLKDRIRETRTPINPARCHTNQGAYTMSELKKRIHNEIIIPAKAREASNDAMGETPEEKPG
jgi:hypothetical protein